MMTKSTVHIIDDDARICRAITRLLQSHDYSVETYSSAKRFLRRDPLEGNACIVLDLKMPEITGLDLQRMLADQTKLVPIIFMSGAADSESLVRAMKRGAIYFLLKPFDDCQLLSAVDSALSLSAAAFSKRDEVRKDSTAFSSLTPREQQVCLRIVQGLLNKQVGYELGTTEKTVKVQRARVMRKLGANSLPDIVRLVERLKTAGALPSDSRLSVSHEVRV